MAKEKTVSKTANKKKTGKKVVSKAAKGSSKTNKKSVAKDILEPKAKKEPHKDCKWYVLNVRPGYEKSVSDAIKQIVEATNTEDVIADILVPVQKKIVVKQGKQKIQEEKIFPGYVLIKMLLDEKTWSIIAGTEGVRGFVKTDKYPRPLPEKEVRAIMKFMEVEQPAYQASFSVGEAVKIIDGAFADFIGSVNEIDESKGKVKVMISFLGREAPVELDFSQVTKL